MSVASAIFSQSADVLAIVHDDDLRLQPANVLVSGYVQDMAEVRQPGSVMRPHFQVLSDLISHVIHIRRSKLVGVNLEAVTSIDFGSSSYRVKHFRNDADKPEVAFHCTL